jgi:outer membrane protein assembly factor BamB
MTYGASGSASVTVTDSSGRVATGRMSLSTVGNGSPVIHSITAYPQPVYTAANLLCSASDPNGDSLNYSWSVGGITGLIAPASSAAWYSPGIPGYYLAEVSVTDAYGGSATGSTSISIAGPSPWPKKGGNIQSTGLSPADTSGTTAGIKWTYQVGGTPGTGNGVRSGLSIGSGTLYFGSIDNSVYAVRTADGSLKWSYDTGGDVHSTPAVGIDGIIYAGSLNNSVYALDPVSGLPIWSYALNNGVNSSPAIGADGTIYFGSIDNSVYALDSDGTLKWSYPTGDDISVSSPAIAADGTVYIGSRDNSLYALNPDGTLKWSYSTGGEIFSSPAIGADGTIYVGSQDLYFHAVNPDGTVKWISAIVGGVPSSPAIGPDGTVYVGSWTYGLQAFDPDDGSFIWTCGGGGLTCPSLDHSPVVGADGTIYVGTRQADFIAVNPDGTFKWAPATGWYLYNYSSAAIDIDGTIYTGDNDGTVYALK